MAIDKHGISTGKDVRLLAEKLEYELLNSYRKQFVQKNDMLVEMVDWDTWRSDMVRKFAGFKRETQKILNKYRSMIFKESLKDFKDSYQFGIELVTRQTAKLKLESRGRILSFAKNDRVLVELQKLSDYLDNSYRVAMNSLETQFFQTVQRVQYLKDFSGIKTLFQAIDMANRDLIQTGIVGAITSDNRRINIANQIEMTIVETSQEIMFIGEATKSEDLGIYTVYISQHASSCPLCTPWQGKVLIDDVYMDGKPDGKHELLSTAIKAGLFHYNCRHNRITYIEGIDVIPDSEKNALKGMSKAQQHALYKAEQELRYNERMIRQWKRAQLLATSLPEQEKAAAKVREWQARQRDLVKRTDGLFRQYWREKPGFKVPNDVRWRNLKYDKQLFDR